MPRCSEHRRSRLPTAHLDQHDQPRRPVCAAGQPAGPQASQGCGLSMRAREFPALTGRSGTHPARRRSLGYEPTDVRLRCPGQSPVTGLTSADRRLEVVRGSLYLSRLSLSRRVRFTNRFTEPVLYLRLSGLRRTRSPVQQSRRHGADPDRLFFRPDICPVGTDRVSVMRCRWSLLVVVGRCYCCHRCCQSRPVPRS